MPLLWSKFERLERERALFSGQNSAISAPIGFGAFAIGGIYFATVAEAFVFFGNLFAQRVEFVSQQLFSSRI